MATPSLVERERERLSWVQLEREMSDVEINERLRVLGVFLTVEERNPVNSKKVGAREKEEERDLQCLKFETSRTTSVTY